MIFKKIRWLLLGLFFLISCFEMVSQNTTLEIKPTDSLHTILFQSLSYKKRHLDKVSVEKELKKILKNLQFIGFLHVNTALLKKNDSCFIANISTSTKINHINLAFDASLALPDFISANQPSKTTIPFYQLNDFIRKLTNYYESNGQPFTQIQLSSIKTDKNSLSARVTIKPTKKRKIDKIVLKGYEKFPRKFLKQHLFLRLQNRFNQQVLKDASKRINSLSFVEEIRTPEVLFTKDATHIYLYLLKKRPNKFDALLGFSSKENNSGLKFNGYIDIELNNAFNRGESLSLYWSNNGNHQEKFQFKNKSPYLFNSPFSHEFKFEIYKQDSSFVNIDFYTALDYQITQHSKIGSSLGLKRSNNLLENPLSSNIKSYHSNFYGATYSYLLRDENLSSPKFLLKIKGLYGKRTAETIVEKQYDIEVEILYLTKLNHKTQLFAKNNTRTLVSKDILFNELFKLGGSNSIRGFREESLFASAYSYLNLELRYLTNKTSYLYLFLDMAYTENKTKANKNQFYGIGPGYTYSTDTGTINLSYGFGKTDNQPFNLNKGIFHVKLMRFF